MLTPSLLRDRVQNVEMWKSQSGANPTIVSYNASVVKFYNTTNSTAGFFKIKIFSPTYF
jgi:hypothetical protein